MTNANKFVAIASGELSKGVKGAAIREGSVHWNTSPTQSLYCNMFDRNDYWCAMFVSWCAEKAGELHTRIPRHMATTVGADWFKAQGRWTTDRTKARRGDIAYFKNGSARGYVNHVGIVERDFKNQNKLQTIDGNTSSVLYPGSQDTGGCVARKDRTTDTATFKFIGLGQTGFDPGDFTTSPGEWEVTPELPTGGIVADGYWGSTTTRFLQKRFGTTVDGVISGQEVAWRSKNPGLTSGWEWTSNPKGSRLILAMQKWLGVSADGIAGPGTFRALQSRLGKIADGNFSAPSPAIAEMQRRLMLGTL